MRLRGRDQRLPARSNAAPKHRYPILAAALSATMRDEAPLLELDEAELPEAVDEADDEAHPPLSALSHMLEPPLEEAIPVPFVLSDVTF